jgi:uncharacterized repeat protein (TIGR03803 family)
MKDRKPNSILRIHWLGACAAIALILIASLSAGAQTVTVLYNFRPDINPADGFGPKGTLLMDSKGNLYGTTEAGGSGTACLGFGCGIIFKIDTAGRETILHTFNLTDGANPLAGLVMDLAGNMYGTTSIGGNTTACPPNAFTPGGCGTIYKLDTAGNYSVLYQFTGGSEGANPTAGTLAIDSSGTLYGVAGGGGLLNCTAVAAGGGIVPVGCGVAFKFDTNANSYTVLHSFTSGADGATPAGGLIMDAAGNLYGTAMGGGAGVTFPGGVVYELLAPSYNTEVVLHTFDANNFGTTAPGVGVIMDSKGNLFGGTLAGDGFGNDGAIFELTPSGTIAFADPLVLGPTTAAFPLGSFVMDKKGNIYGPLSAGIDPCGVFTVGGCGAIFKVDKAGHFSLFHTFSGPDGIAPYGGLIMDKKGNIYGTTFNGPLPGLCSCGTVFKITPH